MTTVKIILLLSFLAGANSQAKLPSEIRFISLSPAITELVYALGVEKNLVGVSEFSDFPLQAKEKKSVGPYTHPNLELIYSLKPDLVLLPLEGPADIKTRLDQMHITYKVVDMRKLGDIGDAAKEIGDLLGNKLAGETFKKNWDTRITALFSNPSLLKPLVFVEVQKSPLMGAGEQTFLNEIVRGCGGTNAVTQNGYPALSLEWAASERFKLVLLTDFFHSDSEKRDALKWWKTLPSAKNAKITAINSDLTSRPGPRLLEGIKIICSEIAAIR